MHYSLIILYPNYTYANHYANKRMLATALYRAPFCGGSNVRSSW